MSREYKNVTVNNVNYKIDANITEKPALNLFKSVIEEYSQTNGEINKTVLFIAESISMLENTKQKLLVDIKERGVVEYFVNGSQEMYRDNKSIDKVNKIVEQQRKLLAELKLTPASQKEAVRKVTKGDDFEGF